MLLFFSPPFVYYLSKWLEVNQSGRLGIKEFNKRYLNNGESPSAPIIPSRTAQPDGGGAVAAGADSGLEGLETTPQGG